MSTEFDKTFPNEANTPIIMKIGFKLFLEILGKCTFARKITIGNVKQTNDAPYNKVLQIPWRIVSVSYC